MAQSVQDIMNPELFSVLPSESVQTALDGILAVGITGAAVVDDKEKPVGVVSLRDLTGAPKNGPIRERMTSPAAVIRENAGVDAAARLLGETGYRRLVVVDEDGRAVGMVSAIDVIRGLTGLPAKHPGSFPHLDAKTGLTWTDDQVFDMEHVPAAPDGPGILVLVNDAPGTPRRIVWVGSAYNVRTHLTALLNVPQHDPELRRWLAQPAHLLFRAAAVSDPERRELLLKALRPKGGPALMHPQA